MNKLYSPFASLEVVGQVMNQLFDKELNAVNKDFYKTEKMSSAINWVPKADLKEAQDKFIVSLDLPGVDPKSIKITVKDNILTLEGEKESEKNTEQHGYLQIERSYGRFKREFSLPNNVKVDGISASAKYGTLHINIPKEPIASEKQIAIEVAEC